MNRKQKTKTAGLKECVKQWGQLPRWARWLLVAEIGVAILIGVGMVLVLVL